MGIVEAVLQIIGLALPSLIEGGKALLSGKSDDEALSITAENLATAQAQKKFPNLDVEE